MSYRIHLTLVVVCVLLSRLAAQPGYKLDFKINGWKDTTAFLGHYNGESTIIKDFTKVDSQGAFSFEGKKPLPPGVYFLELSKKRVFDFVVGSDQKFRLETTSDDCVKNMKVAGDEDNELFFENLAFTVERHKEAERLVKILQDTTVKDEKKRKEASEAFGKVNKQLLAYQRSLFTKHPATVTARIVKASLRVEAPDPPRRTGGPIDSTFQLRYYREHFFDNFDLSDEVLIHLPHPLYKEKVKEYLDNFFLLQPDTITRAIDKLMVKAKKNPETYKYLGYTCIFLYQTSEVMGLDEVFINLYNKYIATGEMDNWANAQLKKILKDQADKLGRALIGRTAPNLIMQDENLQPRSLYDIKKKYTIIFFFMPDCSHCREESPKLVDFYNRKKNTYDLEVFAVSSDTSIKKMRDFIQEMKMTWITVSGPHSYLKVPYNSLYFAETYPTIYILDEKKKIIARRLLTEKLDSFLANYDFPADHAETFPADPR